MIPLFYGGNEYALHIIIPRNYRNNIDWIKEIDICEHDVISKSFENLSYLSLEDMNVAGFFITDPKNKLKVYASMIVDFSCDKNKEIITHNNFNLNNSAEITLLCANLKNHVSGLTNYFLKIAIYDFIKKFKPEIEYMFLHVAKGINNSRAYHFYHKFGFEIFDENHTSVLCLNVKNKSILGGMKIKKRTKHKKTLKGTNKKRSNTKKRRLLK